MKKLLLAMVFTVAAANAQYTIMASADAWSDGESMGNSFAMEYMPADCGDGICMTND